MSILESRIHPLVDLELSQLRDMVAPVARGASVREAIRLDGGLINTVYQVVLAGSPGVVVRIYTLASPAEIEAECRLLEHLAVELPVPEVLYADPEGEEFGLRYVIYRWTEGITLNDYRRGAAPEELALLGAPLGRVLAEVADHRRADFSTPRSVCEAVQESMASLHAGLSRERIGGELADGLEALLSHHSARLAELDRDRSLVHGDLGGRNLLVAPGEGRPWRITGVLDWDTVACGSSLWDVGSFFRYSHRYDEAFRAAFEQGYRDADGELPADWWLLSRLVDSTRLVAILDEPRPLPKLFAECQLLVAALLTDFGVLE